MFSLAAGAPFHLLQGCAKVFDTWHLLFLGRLLVNFFFGTFLVLLSIFLTEISPSCIRGELNSFLVISLSFGSFLGSVLSLESLLGYDELWPYSYLIITFLGLPALPLVFCLPESPVYFLARNRPKEADLSIAFYYGTVSDVDMKNLKLDAEIAATEKIGLRGFVNIFKYQALRLPLKLSMLIGIAGGAFMLIYYNSTTILISSGISPLAASYCTVALKLLSLVANVMCLLLIKQMGRRPLLLMGCIGTALSFLLLGIFQWFSGIAWASLSACLSLFLAQAFIHFSVRPLRWIVVPEMFPHKYRSTGKAFITGFTELYQMVLVFGYMMLLSYAPVLCHWFVALTNVLCFSYFVFRFRETKRRMPHEVFPEILEMDVLLKS